jgi:alpha-D-ribose 1-methylphosphonate 5-triphosphate diphosphatase
MADALATGPSGGSLVSSAFALSRLPGWDLPRAWALISQAPAQILRLPDRGVIDLGKRADLVLVNAETEAVEGTICEGRASFLSGEAKSRFFGALGEERLAAE